MWSWTQVCLYVSAVSLFYKVPWLMSQGISWSWWLMMVVPEFMEGSSDQWECATQQNSNIWLLGTNHSFFSGLYLIKSAAGIIAWILDTDYIFENQKCAIYMCGSGDLMTVHFSPCTPLAMSVGQCQLCIWDIVKTWGYERILKSQLRLGKERPNIFYTNKWNARAEPGWQSFWTKCDLAQPEFAVCVEDSLT